jgi:hypothetical protein
MPPTSSTTPSTRLPPSEAVIRSVVIVQSPGPATPPRPRRRPVAARARTALLCGAAAFVLGQLALALAIEWRLPQLRDPHYAHKEERLLRRLAEAPAPPRTVLMIGSSRTVSALRGQEVERALAGPGGAPVVFNFGIPGAGPLTELLTLRRLLARGVKPDLLLVEVLPPVLAGHVPLAEVTRMDPARLWHADLPLVERYLPDSKVRAGWWEALPLPCHSHRFAIVSETSPGLLPLHQRLDWFRVIDDSGWGPPPNPDHGAERRRLGTENARREYTYYLTDFRLGGPNPPALRELLDLCRQQGIVAVLVLMPEGSDFRGWYPPPAWAQVEGFLAELRRDYGVAVVNARDWLPDEEFADSHHQFPEGASRFSERLAREVIAPRLAGR